MKKAIVNFFKGILVGVANIIPGVSGGTIAVILGVFDELIEAINGFFKNMKKYIIFLLPIGAGAVIGILGLSKILKPALEQYPFETNLFFVGLVAGSIPLIYNKAMSKKFKLTYLIPLVISLVVVVVLAFVQKPMDEAEIKALQEVTQSGGTNASLLVAPKGVGDYIYLLLGGALASAAMVVPGISGSFVMVLIGLYGRIIAATDGLTNPETMIDALLVLLPVGIGVVAGIFIIAKIIEKLLKHAFSYTYFAILGLILGSIFSILYSPKTYHTVNGTAVSFGTLTIIIAVLTFAVGFTAAYFLGKDKE